MEIRGSARWGLLSGNDPYSYYCLEVLGKLRITENGFPAILSAPDVSSLVPTPGSPTTGSAGTMRMRWASSSSVMAGTQAGVEVTACNLYENGGFGVNNLGPDTVNAAGNWWGDSEGPGGPTGDGVSGPVLTDPVLTAPADTSSS